MKWLLLTIARRFTEASQNRYAIKTFIITFILILSTAAQAHNKVVVIPLLGDKLKPLKNIVTVAKANGDFTDPVAAVASINDASDNNPYLIIIAPGVYILTEAVVMKQYVDISGSGENVTELIGEISSSEIGITSAIVALTSNSTLSNLSVQNRGGDIYSIGVYGVATHASRIENVTITALGAAKIYGIYNTSNYTRITNVFITVTGGMNSYGVFNTVLSQPVLSDVTITLIDAERAIGIYNLISHPQMNRVTIKVAGSLSSYGMYNNDMSSPIMNNISITATGGEDSNNVYGIHNYDQSSPTMTNIVAIASGGVNSYGVFNSTNSSSTIRRSTLAGDTNGLKNSNDSYGAFVGQSSIKNGVSGGGGTCIACDNGTGAALTADCINEN